MPELLRLENVVAGYGDSVVIDDVSLSLEEGDSLALLGRNGVGKSTLLITLMGLTRLHRGSVLFRGRDLAAVPTFRRVRSGLGWVPQERLVFPSLTVEEHLTAVARRGPWTPKRVYETFPRLGERREHMGNQLSGGEQQMLAIGRALAARPTLLLLDEPSTGLSPLLVREIFRLIGEINRAGTTVLLVEQNAYMALSVANRAHVLENGSITVSGDASTLRDDPKVRAAYLGDSTG